MMLYEVPSSFIKIDETKGILQNASSSNSLEVSNENEVNSGIILKPGESLSFQDTDIYVRTVGSNKNSAVRVVPFVEGFSAGSSDSGDFDIRQYDSTGILIYYKDAAGTLHEKPVHYVNPNSTNAQLAALGKSIIAVTNNTYQSTYRVTKSLCDPHLIVDSPFTQDLTDNCGVVWNVTGSVPVEEGHVVLNSGYLRADQNITLGGQDFSVSFYARANSASSGWAGICALYVNNANGISFYRNNQTTTINLNVYDSTNAILLNAFAFQNALNAEHHFEIDYTHDDTTLRVFLDGTLATSVVGEFKRGQHTPTIGYNNTNASLRMNGYIRNLQIYDDGALHTEDFTPD